MSAKEWANNYKRDIKQRKEGPALCGLTFSLSTEYLHAES